jgi:hypothetical protein
MGVNQMLLSLYAKNQDPLVKYNQFTPIRVNQESISVNNVNFHIPTLVEEVKKTPRKKLKEYQKAIKLFLTTAATFPIFASRSMASGLNATPTSNLPHSAEGIPPELLHLLIQLVVIIVAVGVIASIILLVVSGIGRMFRMKGMTQWTTDIVKGLIQVMVAVPVVFMVYYLANLIFGGSGWWVSPFTMH